MSHEQLKINLLIKYQEQFHVDTLDMYSARHRAAYIKQASHELGCKRLTNPMLLIYRKCFILLAGTLLNSKGVIFHNPQLFGRGGFLLKCAHNNDTVLGHVFSPFVLN